jgi:hypothetical protein
MEELDSQASAADRGRSALRWLWLPAVFVVVAVGVWITGGVITNDEAVAKVLTGLWFALAALAVLVLAWVRRGAAVPAITGYAVAAVGIGGFLLYTSTVDQVVDEDVVVAAPELSATENGSDTADTNSASGTDEPADDVNTLISKGDFVDGEHPTSGVASIIDTDRGMVVTLTSFETDPGPDLRVYFVPPGTDVGAGEDLGALKGNKGDQQYDMPGSWSTGDLERGSVVIWCRAFSVAFGSAELA